ncbi:P27 family phage terminase small subunit [uncultured Bacteroides sp.]|uniref:P27 family phage terminase small subunit n=1 Tax=uncultured Bacteroides sp. TaxID=162156 RepID=UPI002AA69249|nr:P27 family phage terminase small subunit [uncultured Bacteroides sp.]
MPKVKFKIPDTILHDEAIKYIRAVVKKLTDDDELNPTDFPQLRRLAKSYDDYLSCEDWLSTNKPIMENNKGEIVKHPYVNIQRECWNQFIFLAKEYGFTMKSKSSMRSAGGGEEESPLDKLLSKK